MRNNRNKKIIILDIPLLLENKINKKNDILIFVQAKKRHNEKIEKRDNFNLKIIKKFKKIQLSLDYKKKKSNFIIKNNFSRNQLKRE